MAHCKSEGSLRVCGELLFNMSTADWWWHGFGTLKRKMTRNTQRKPSSEFKELIPAIFLTCAPYSHHSWSSLKYQPMSSVCPRGRKLSLCTFIPGLLACNVSKSMNTTLWKHKRLKWKVYFSECAPFKKRLLMQSFIFHCPDTKSVYLYQYLLLIKQFFFL